MGFVIFTQHSKKHKTPGAPTIQLSYTSTHQKTKSMVHSGKFHHAAASCALSSAAWRGRQTMLPLPDCDVLGHQSEIIIIYKLSLETKKIRLNLEIKTLFTYSNSCRTNKTILQEVQKIKRAHTLYCLYVNVSYYISFNISLTFSNSKNKATITYTPPLSK